jgi:hypothetical protein
VCQDPYHVYWFNPNCVSPTFSHFSQLPMQRESSRTYLLRARLTRPVLGGAIMHLFMLLK